MKKFVPVVLAVTMLVTLVSVGGAALPNLNTVNPTGNSIKGIIPSGNNELDEEYGSYVYLLGSVTLPSAPTSIVAEGNYVYAVCGADGLQILDFTNQSSPTVAGTFAPALQGETIVAVVVDGDYAYLASDHGMYVVNVSDPTSPSQTYNFLSGTGYTGVTKNGNYIYMAYTDHTEEVVGALKQFDVSDPANPVSSDSVILASSTTGQVEYNAGYVYVSNGGSGIAVVDVSAAPTLPTPTYIGLGGDEIRHFAVNEDHLETVGENNNDLFDISDPTTPVAIYQNASAHAYGVDLDGQMEAYTARLTSSDYEYLGVYFYPSWSSTFYLLGAVEYTLGDGVAATRIQGENVYAVVGSSVRLYDASEAFSRAQITTIVSIDPSRFPEITCVVSVQDLDGNPVTGLTSQQYPVEYFVPYDGYYQDVPTSVTVLEDGNYEVVYTTTAPANSETLSLVMYVADPIGGDYFPSQPQPFSAPGPYTVTIETIDKSAFPEISVTVSVVDGQEAVVAGLTTANFDLIEEDTEQTLTSVTDNGADGYELVFTSTDAVSEGVRSVQVNVHDGEGAGSDQMDYTASLITGLTVAVDTTDASLFPEVRSFVRLTDQNDERVTGFSASSFAVTEDAASQTPLTVTELGGGVVATGMMMNFSSSMDADEIADQEAAFTNYIQAFTGSDSGRVSQYGASTVVYNWVRDDQSSLLNDLDMYEDLDRNGRAVWHAATLSAANGVTLAHYRVGLIVVDGPNTHTGDSFTDAVASINNSNVHMYVVGLGPDVDADSLQMLADQTGGLYFHAKESSELPGLFTLIAEAVHSNYAIAYNTSNDLEDGTTRNLTVEASIGDVSDSDSGSYDAPLRYGVNIPSAVTSPFPVVTVTVNVFDYNDDPLSGLTMADFELWEDDVAQTLTSVTEQATGSYEVVYTTSNTTEDGSDRYVYVEVGGGVGSDDIHYTSHLFTPTLTITSKNAVLNLVVDVPVIADDIENVSVIELYIDFDDTKLTFTDLIQDNLTGAVFNDNNGTVIVSWFSTTPLNLADGDTLFTLQFSVDGLVNGETTDLMFGDGSYIADYNANLFNNAVYNDGVLTGINTAAISGRLSYFTSDISLAGATVHLGGDTTLTAISDENGEFLFEEIRPGDYLMIPELAEEGHQGVNTLDAYRIQVSLDEINPFETGYQYFAADVDLSQVVNTLDAYNIQRRVVGLIDGFSGGGWAFISSSYEMTTENWADAEQFRNLSLMGIDSTDQDFFGVRRGDANNTWPSLFIGSDEEEEITGSMTIADAVVGPGGTATVELRAEGLMDLGVIEYHIAFDPSVVTLQHINVPELGGAVTQTTDSTISVSWFDIANPINCDDRIVGLFTFEAVNEVNVQSDIELTEVVLGDMFGTELFTEENDGSIMVSNVTGVNFQGAELVTDWALRPSYPNPFNAYTTLSFDVKESAEVQIHVYNVLGDLVTTLVQGNLPKGRYAKSVNAQTWSSGTYFVVMKTKSFNKVQKIVLLK